MIDAGLLTERWNTNWPGCRPIGYELRNCAADRWVRFHSLPESKRYAETSEERAEILRRHHIVLRELLGDEAFFAIASLAWTESPESPAIPEHSAALDPPTFWRSILVERDHFEHWGHFYVSSIEIGSAGLDALLLEIADDQTSGVILAPTDLAWLYHPYDGGADVIAPTPQRRDQLRSRHSAWLSAHPGGL